MATCQELNANQLIGSSQPESENICGTGTIVFIEEGYGIIQSRNKGTMYFGETHYLPPTKGILQVLKRKDRLCFVAKPSSRKKIKWTAVNVWKPGYEPGCEVKPKHSKTNSVKQGKKARIKQNREVEALSFLKGILEPDVSLNIKNLPAFISRESLAVQAMFLDEQKTLAFLKRHPSVFHFSDTDNNVKLISEAVQKAITFVAGVLVERGRLDLVSLHTALIEQPDEVLAVYGEKSRHRQLKSFLRRFPDVYNLTKEGDKWFVALQLSFYCDSDDVESLVSSASLTTFDSTGVRSRSTTSSMLSLSAGSSLHTSMSDLSVSLPAKTQGISKMLNALLKKEPMPVKNLIGYIHTSPPEIRKAIGNTMEMLTDFLQNDENFFLQKPENLVFIRSTVEKRALKYLTDLVTTSKEGEVKLDDVLKFQGKYALPEVRAYLGKNVSGISLAVWKLISKDELMSGRLLVLRDDLLSVEYSSHSRAVVMHGGDNVQQLSENKYQLLTDQGNDFLSKAMPGSSKRKELVSYIEKSENQAVDFLLNILERDEMLTTVNVREHLWQASAEICAVLFDEDLITAFIKRHPSVFKMSGPLNLIELIDDAIRDAIAFCFNILNVKGDMLVSSLVGHMSSASPRIRRVTGGAPAKLEDFLRQYFDVFHVYEGEQGLMASSKLKKHIFRGLSTTVASTLKDFADGRVSATTTEQKTEFSKEELDDVNRRFASASAANDSQNKRVVHPTHEEPKAIKAKRSAGLDFLTGLLKMHTTVVLKDIVKLVCEASVEIHKELGYSEQEILSFVEENPAIFKISGSEFCIELISETFGDAIEFFLNVLNRRGPTPVAKLHGHLSQASLTIRNATGGSPESVKAFLLQFPNVFKSYKDNGIEVIASLYEGECVSESSDTNDNEKLDVVVATGADVATNSKPIENRETTSIYRSNFDDPGFDFAHTLSERSSKAIKTTTGSTLKELEFDPLPTMSEKSLQPFDNGASSEFNRLDQLDFDYILSMSDTNQFRGAETKGDVRIKLYEIEDSDESTSSVPASPTCESTAAKIKTNFCTKETTSNRNVRVDIATETHPHNVVSSLQLPPLPREWASGDLTDSQKADIASLVKCAKVEHNVISDLCLQALCNNNGRALDITELLTICQKADLLQTGWQQTLRLENLSEIIGNDDRFFVNKSNGSVMLIRDVEFMAAEFLRRCILYYGPMVLEKLKTYNYLTFAATEVQELLGTPGLACFKKKSIKLLWQKYRDQLLVQNGVLVVPQDAESDALRFLSNLIETYGPLRVDSLPNHLPQASSLVSEFLKERLDCIEAYLQSNGLEKQFIVWNGVVDLVRSGNLQKNRLIVEQTAASFLVNTICLGGPIAWNQASKRLDLQKATPEVREFLGTQWNATSVKQVTLHKFCSERPDLFIVQADGIHLLADQRGGNQSRFLDERSDRVSDACPASTCDSVQTRGTEQRAVQFLRDIIARLGAIGCKQKQLRSRFDLKDAPSDVRAMLGGQIDAVSFKKKSLMSLSLRHPTVFTTYKRSVDLNRSVYQPPPASAIVEPLQVAFDTRQNIWETRRLAAEASQLRQHLISTVVTQMPSEPSLPMPLMHSEFPAATTCLPATAATVLPLTTLPVVTWPSFTASYPSSSLPAAVPLLPQMAYFPLSQAPLTQYSYEPSLGLPLNLGQPSQSLQHSLMPAGFETLPQIALYPRGTSSLTTGSLSSAFQGGITSYAPGALASQLMVPIVKPLGNSMPASQILPLARMSPLWRQPIPVQPAASFASACVQPLVDAPYVDAVYSHHTQPLSFVTPLPLPSDQGSQNTPPLTSTSAQTLANAPNATRPFYDTLESDSTVTHDVMELVALEGEKLEESGEAEKAKVVGEPKKLNSPEDVEELNEMESREGLEELHMAMTLARVKDTENDAGKLLLEVAQMTGASEKSEGFSETITSSILMDEEAEIVSDTSCRPQGSDNILMGKDAETKMITDNSCILSRATDNIMMEKYDAKAEIFPGNSYASHGTDNIMMKKDAEVVYDGPCTSRGVNKVLMEKDAETEMVTDNSSTSHDTNSILMNKDTEAGIVPDNPCMPCATDNIMMEKDAETQNVSDNLCMSKSHGTLNSDDAMVRASSAAIAVLSLNDAEVSNDEADASPPCNDSSMKSLTGNNMSPVTWKSMAQSAELPDFNEQFGQLFDGASEYLSFLSEEACRTDLTAAVECLSDDSELDVDLYETAESDDDAEEQDFEEVTGTVLTASGNQVYVKREDDQVVPFTSGNCSRHFEQCCNLGRHFAVGESISLRYKKFPRELVSARSLCAPAADDEARGPCCSNLHVNLGHGRVALAGKNYVVFMMSSQEMTGFVTLNPHLFSPNDLVHFCSTKVSGFMTPWRSHFVLFTNQEGVTFASKSDPRLLADRIPNSSPWKLTTDAYCQTDMTCSAMSTLSDSRSVPVINHQSAQTLSTGRVMSFGYCPGM